MERQLPSVLAIGKPIRALAAAMRMSQTAAIAAPPPVQAPAMAATAGLGQASIALSTASIRCS
jgi:hypothetical protein